MLTRAEFQRTALQPGHREGGWPANPVAAAVEVGSLFTGANEVELAFLMRMIAEGDTTMATRIARRILDVKSVPGRPAPPQPPASPKRALKLPSMALTPSRSALTPRELEVLQMISQGMSNREIAETRCRSTHTIDAQVKNIYRKMAVKSRAQAVREAMQKGLLSPEVRGC